MASLYQLTEQATALLAMATDMDLDPQMLQDTLEGLGGEIALKCDDYAAVMRQISAEIDMYSAEAEFIEKNIAYRQNALKRMKEAVKNSMIALEKDEIKGEKFTFKLVNNGGKIPMIIDGDVPDSFTKITVAPDNEKIRAALEDGQSLDFAHLGERGKNLRIK